MQVLEMQWRYPNLDESVVTLVCFPNFFMNTNRSSDLPQYRYNILQYLGYKDECHGEEAAEHVGEAHKGEARIRLVGDDEGDGGRDHAEHRHIVDRHAHQPAVVDLLHLQAGHTRSPTVIDHQLQ